MIGIYVVCPMDPSTSQTEGMESGVLWPGLNTELKHIKKSWNFREASTNFSPS